MSESADETKGRVKEAVGELTDDDELKREGKLDKMSGKAKDKIDDVKDRINELIDDA